MKPMTDIEVSDCCGYHVTRDNKGTLICALCRNPCHPIWEILTWEPGTPHHPPTPGTSHTTTAQNTGTTDSPATNDHEETPHDPHAR